MQDLFSVKDKVVIVTGASSGIGRHFACTLAGAGAKVVIGARRLENLQATVEQIVGSGGTVRGMPLDVTDRHSVQQFVSETIKQFGHIDVLVNNAGVSVAGKSFFDYDDDDWQRVIDTNLKGVWMMTQVVVEQMLATQTVGSIINISSAADLRTRPHIMFVAYNASKAGVSHMTRAMAAEFADRHIRVNAIAPGYFSTEMTQALPQQSMIALLEKIPMHRFGELNELDGALLLLASDASRYISGSIIRVDGALGANAL